MTYVGLDVHARSTHAAAIDVASGELRRARFGGGTEEVVGWLGGLPQPLHGCYEAGPTGFALYRSAEVAGLSGNASTSLRPSWPISTRSQPSTASSLARPHSRSGFRGSPARGSGGRRSRGCAASAVSTP